MDFDVQSVLEEMKECCDAQGRLFIEQALQIFRVKLETGVCVQRRPKELSSPS